MMWSGIPSFSAQWMWAKLDGLAVIVDQVHPLLRTAVSAIISI